MIRPAQKYLTLRSIGAPSLLLSLSMQGIFRGFKDTKTPLYATGKQSLLFKPFYSSNVLVIFYLLLDNGDMQMYVENPIQRKSFHYALEIEFFNLFWILI